MVEEARLARTTFPASHPPLRAGSLSTFAMQRGTRTRCSEQPVSSGDRRHALRISGSTYACSGPYSQPPSTTPNPTKRTFSFSAASVCCSSKAKSVCFGRGTSSTAHPTPNTSLSVLETPRVSFL